MHFTDEQLKYIQDNLRMPSNGPDTSRVWLVINNKVSIEICKRANKKRLEEETK